jgi:RHS repeat-associated protein
MRVYLSILLLGLFSLDLAGQTVTLNVTLHNGTSGYMQSIVAPTYIDLSGYTLNYASGSSPIPPGGSAVYSNTRYDWYGNTVSLDYGLYYGCTLGSRTFYMTSMWDFGGGTTTYVIPSSTGTYGVDLWVWGGSGGACDGSDGATNIDDLSDGARKTDATLPCGMPVWQVSEPYISLWLKDEPLGYQPGCGPRVAFELAFNQRESVNPAVFSAGQKWNVSWLSYVSRDANANNVVYFPGGGHRTYFTTNDYLTGTSLGGNTTSGFTVSYPDGSQDVYGFVVTNSGGGFLNAFLTARLTPQAQKTQLTYYNYNPANPVIQLQYVIDGDGHTNVIHYATNNAYSTNLISQVTDPFGHSVSLAYDSLGHLTNITDVGGISSSFLYDTNINCVTNLKTPYGTTSFAITDTTGANVAPNGRSVQVTEPDGGTELYLYQDSEPGVAVSYSSGVPSTTPFTNTLDNADLNLRDSFHWGRMQYAALSTTNISMLTSNDFLKARMKHWLVPKAWVVGQTISMERAPSPDTAENIEGQKTWYDYAGKTNSESEGAQYLPLLVGRVLPDGYDGIEQVTSWRGKEVGGTLRQNEQLGYSYDAARNLHIRTNGSLAQTFSVDSLNQLSSATRAGTFAVTGATPAPATNVSINGVAAQTYGDFTFANTNNTLANGANTFQIVATNLYGISVTNDLTVNLPATVTFQYDANGNLTNDGTRSFYFDAENQPTNVIITGQTRVDFVYDGLKRKRITREYAWESGWVETNEIRYIYDGMLVIQERDTNNNPQVTYTRGLDLNLSLQGMGGIGGLLARTDSSGSCFYHSDGNGNITALIDVNGNIVARYEYDAYGRLIGMWGRLAAVNVYRFSSKEYNAVTGLYYYGYRFYDPILQRWLNSDPLGFADGPNAYIFVRNGPVMFFDPYGEYTAWEILQITGAFAQGAGQGAQNVGNAAYNTVAAPAQLAGTLWTPYGQQQVANALASAAIAGANFVTDPCARDQDLIGLDNRLSALLNNPDELSKALANVGVLAATAGLGDLAGGAEEVNVLADTAEGTMQTATQLEFNFAEDVTSSDATYLYQKVRSTGEHLKFGITDDPATRYTAAELNGGSLNIIAQGERSEMLGLERQLHETLPLGPEERQSFYIQMQIQKGLLPPSQYPFPP